MRYVIIGSNSFSGSHLVNELLASPDNEVVGISRSLETKALYRAYGERQHHPEYAASQFSFYTCDIVRDFELLMILIDNFRPDYVINYAAQTEVFQSYLTPLTYFETNTVAVVMLCNELRQRDYLKRYIHISSAEVYGSTDFPVLETTPPHPATPYAVSKLAADQFILALFKHSGFPAIIIRSTNVYGKHQQLYKIIPRSVIRLKNRNQIELHDGGRFIRPFIHAKDAARGVIAAIEKGAPGDIYNFSAECNLSVAEVVKLVCEKMGLDFEAATVSVEERTGNDLRYCLDYSKARSQLEWLPEIPFEEGVDEVISWIEGNWDAILDEPLVYVHKE